VGQDEIEAAVGVGDILLIRILDIAHKIFLSIREQKTNCTS
jgi:hypothetical protein